MGVRLGRRLAGLLAAALTGALLAVVPAVPVAAAGTATLGSTAVGAATDSGDSNHMNASRVVTGSAGGTVSSVSVHVGAVGAAPNNQDQVAVYADAAGKPGALVASSTSAVLAPNA